MTTTHTILETAIQPAKTARWKRRLIVASACLVVIGFFYDPLLTAYARLLTVPSGTGVHVHAVVLGKSLGGMESITEAAALYESKHADQILIVTETPNRLHSLGIIPTFEATAQQVLNSRGVPESAIQILHRRPAFHEWLTQNADSEVVVIGHQFAAQKDALAMQYEFGSDCANRIHWRPTPDDRFDSSNWWLYKQGVLTVFDESISLAHTLICGLCEMQCDECEADPCDDWDVDQYESELCRTVMEKQGSQSTVQPRMHTN